MVSLALMDKVLEVDRVSGRARVQVRSLSGSLAVLHPAADTTGTTTCRSSCASEARQSARCS